MKAALFSICIAIALAPSASAGGFNLTWGEGCWQDDPSALQSFGCNTNEGSISFTVSFVPNQALEDLIAVEALFDLQSDSPELPDWWQLTAPGACRSGALSAAADFSAAPGGCADPRPGQTPSTVTTWITADYPSDAGWPPVAAPHRAFLAVGADMDTPVSLDSGTECYGLTVRISHQGTTGEGACAGCNTPVTLVLNRLRLVSTRLEVIDTPIDNMCLRWQAGGVTPCDATPAHNRTWGQVKSLYR